MALVGAGLGIEHDHAAVGVAVGHEHFLRGDVHRNVGRRAQPLGRIAVVALPRLADLQDELAVHGELEELAVLLAVAGKPDEIVVVDEDAVLALGPLIALPRSAPVAEQVAGLVEHQHRRSGNAAFRFRRILLGRAFARRQRSRSMHDPDAIILVGGDAGDLPEQPVVRQRLGPERIDLELRHAWRRSGPARKRRRTPSRRQGDARSHALMIFMCFLPGERMAVVIASDDGVPHARRGSETSAAADGLHRLDRDHARALP